MTDHYVYRHIRLDTGRPFYFGKGHGKRVMASSGRNKYWHNILRVTDIRVELIWRGLSEDQAYAKESKAIRANKYFGFAEANFSLVGSRGGPAGIKRSDETRAKMSKAQRGKKMSRPNWRKGIPATEEFKRKCAEVQIGLHAGPKHPMYGRTHTEEARMKISVGMKGKPWSAARREAHEKAKMGVGYSTPHN